ncbi:hypothetical protein CHISP_3401 [Chitinispirillum alkaliphilum]|nr:hypothetical protein CHISP_3401 [Chitinispirillum alkaliphilum]
MKLINIAITFILFWGCSMSSDKKSEKTSGNQYGPLGLTEEQYWNEPISNINETIVEDKLWNSEEVMVIDLPLNIYLDKHNSTPLICLRTIESSKRKKYSLKTTTWLFSVYLESGETSLVKLTRSPDRANNRNSSPGYVAEWVNTDLENLLSISSNIGRNKVTLVCGPEISNSRITEIIPSSDNQQHYGEILESIRNKPLSPSGKMLQELIFKHLDSEHINKSEKVWNVDKKQEDEDFIISLLYRIDGLPRFIYSNETDVIDINGSKVYGAFPIRLVGFDENRELIINKQTTLPILREPEGNFENLIISGHIEFSLSELLLPGKEYKTVYLWIFGMEHQGFLEVSL